MPDRHVGRAAPGREPATAERAALRLLASLFFMWGFITVINNTLLPHLRSVFDLNYIADDADRIGLVHRLFRRLDPVGQADRAGRLPALDGDRPRRHGGRARCG